MPPSQQAALEIHEKIAAFVKDELEKGLAAMRPHLLQQVPAPLRGLAGRGYDLAAGRLAGEAGVAVDNTLARIGGLTVDELLGVIAVAQARRNSVIQGDAR